MKFRRSIKVGRVASCASSPAPSQGYLLIECLVYIGVLLILLGVTYAAFYRCVASGVMLRRNVDDITNALHVGERWRADLRAATGRIRISDDPTGPVLIIPVTRGEIAYQSTTNAVLRRIGSGPWIPQLERVKSSTMAADPRPNVTAWRWELELRPQSRKPVRVRPLFTFIAVPEKISSP